MADVNTVKDEGAAPNKPDIPENIVLKNENKQIPVIDPIASTPSPQEPIINNVCETNGQKDLTLNGETPVAGPAQNAVPLVQTNEEPKVVSDPNPAQTENPTEVAPVKEISQPELIVNAQPALLSNGPEVVAKSEVVTPVGECPTGNGSLPLDDVKSEELDTLPPFVTKPIIPVVSEDEWAKREKFLLEQIAILQKEQGDTSIKGYQLQLKVKTEENYILKAKIINLETELSAVLRKPNAKNKDIVEKIKKQHEDLLTKARGMLFDKTKMIKNQELQIEALITQVSSLKEVVTITKDLLKIRNMEVEHLQQRMECMDLKIKAERERHALMGNKLESGTKVNEELKREYETQLALFKELKVKYEEKFQAMERNQMPPSTSQQSSE